MISLLVSSGSERIHDPGTIWTKSQIDSLIIIKVSSENHIYEDKTYLRIYEKATSDFDKLFDARKIVSQVPGVPQIYTGSDDNKLAINSQPSS